MQLLASIKPLPQHVRLPSLTQGSGTGCTPAPFVTPPHARRPNTECVAVVRLRVSLFSPPARVGHDQATSVVRADIRTRP